MNEAEVRASIEELRKRRTSIPELRDYKPQARGKKAPAEAVSLVPAEETFAGLFSAPPEEEAP